MEGEDMAPGRSAVGGCYASPALGRPLSWFCAACFVREKGREKPVYFLQWLGSETWKIPPVLRKIRNLAHGKAISLAAERQCSWPCDGQAGTFKLFSKPKA